MKVLLLLWRATFFATAILFGLAFCQDSFDQLGGNYDASRHVAWLSPVLLAVMLIDLVVEWRRRKSKGYKEPTPARSAVGVVVASGGAALAYTAHHAYQTGNHALPVTILSATIGLALAAYWFASKYAGQIGEAHFDTTSRPG